MTNANGGEGPDRIVVAIDGPSASGKSTVSRRVAAALAASAAGQAWAHVDSGALYRAVTWKALRDGVKPGDTRAAANVADTARMDFRCENGTVVFTVDGADPGAELRGEAVNENVSWISAVPAVRSRVVRWLRGMTRFGNLVMEGRDIGSAVFPDAALKFYLDAAPEERARRRLLDPAAGGRSPGDSVERVQASLRRRDTIDSGRELAPLRIAEGACVMDTTGMAVESVAAQIADAVRAREKNHK
jgi:cytidylate kinase